VNAAVGGSTNLIIHLIAIARRIGVEVNLQDFDDLGSKIPLLVNLMPSGKHLMEDFFYAGGLPVVMKELEGCYIVTSSLQMGRPSWKITPKRNAMTITS
jgi:L-arabonate dehydrase